MKADKQTTSRLTHTSYLKHFTLIELLVVISIIAILAGLLLPALNRAQAAAKKALCVSQQKQLTCAISMYSSDFSNIYPGAYCLMDLQSAGKEKGNWVKYNGAFDLSPTEGVLWEYVKNDKIYICPIDKSNNLVSYALNRQAHFCNETSIHKPSERLVFIEESGTQNGIDNVYTNDGSFAYLIAKNWKDYVRDWHSSGSVYSYIDGHVAWEIMPIESVWLKCDICNETNDN